MKVEIVYAETQVEVHLDRTDHDSGNCIMKNNNNRP